MECAAGTGCAAPFPGSAEPETDRRRRSLRLLLLPFLLVLLTGCATARSEFHVPDRREWKRSFTSAVKDPDTWIPAVAALAVAAAGVDEDISDWAIDKTPVFGSTHRAETASNELKAATHVLMFATAIPPPGAGPRWKRAAMTALEQEAIVGVVGAVTVAAKNAADRERPDASNRASFPSGHSSGSAATSALARENLQRSAIWPRWHPALRITSRILHGATAWARIEGAKHYPTDVLAGSALGNLLAVTLDRAVRDDVEAQVSISPSREGVAVGVRLRW